MERLDWAQCVYCVCNGWFRSNRVASDVATAAAPRGTAQRNRIKPSRLISAIITESIFRFCSFRFLFLPGLRRRH